LAYLVPERIARRSASLLYAERAARAAGESVQRELQVFALPRLLGKTVSRVFHTHKETPRLLVKTVSRVFHTHKQTLLKHFCK
jgi:hypothetical protein